MTKIKNKISVLILIAIVIAMAAVGMQISVNAQQNHIYDCEVNNLESNLGVEEVKFSYKIKDDGFKLKQTHYQIMVASSLEKIKAGVFDMWESAKVASGDTFDIPYGGKTLESKTKYYWKVIASINNSVDYESELSTFEMGKLDAWTGDFIGNGQSKNDRSAVLLRKEFDVESTLDVAYARAYVCGLGLFDFKLNGLNPDKSVLNPANTSFNKTVLYRTFDVTHLILKGKNAIGVELGNGFYNETYGWNWANAIWRDSPKLNMELDITYTDGSTQSVKTDNTWKTAKGETTANSIYSGEIIDANKKKVGFDKINYDDGSWSNAAVALAPTGKITAQDMPIMQKMAEYKPQIKFYEDKNVNVLTNPVMTTGWAKIKFDAPKNTRITVTYGEKLTSEGRVIKVTTGQSDEYIACGQDDIYEPKFSYKGFKYIEVSGYDKEIKVEDVTAYFIHNDVERISEFQTSDNLINTLHENMVRTMLNNFQGKPTDTPALEKNGWLGDVNVALETMSYNFDITSFMTKFIMDMKDSQSADGSVPQVVPMYQWGDQNMPVWNTAYIFSVYELYNYFGNSSLITKQYDSMKKLVDLDAATLQAGGWVWKDTDLADWVSPGGSENILTREEPAEGSGICATGYVYKALEIMAEFAEKLDKPSDKAAFNLAKDKIYKAFNNKFYDKAKGIYDTKYWKEENKADRTKYRQTSNILPLVFGLVEEQNIDTVIDNLIADIVSKNYHLDTGIVGTKYILKLLSDFGFDSIAYKIVTNTTYPSWGYWVEQGATSNWEMWESVSRSENHYFLGTYDEWFFKYLAGINNVKNSYESFDIMPRITGDLDFVKCSVKTNRGLMQSNWKLENNGGVTFDIIVPFGAVSNIILPIDSIAKVKLNGKDLSDKSEGVISISSVGGVKIQVGSGHFIFEISSPNTEKYYDSLNGVIEGAKLLAKEDYLLIAWEKYQPIYVNAVKVSESKDSTQKQINDAKKVLENAVIELKGNVVAARVELKEFIKSVLSQKRPGMSYSTGMKDNYNNILEKAKAVSVDENSTLEQLVSALANLKKETNKLSAYRIDNLLIGAKASASSSVEADAWLISNLNDADTENWDKNQTETCGWSSSLDINKDHAEFVMFDLGYVQKFDRVDIYPSTGTPNEPKYYGMPKNFQVLVSTDGVDWQTMLEYEDFAVAEISPIVLEFTSVSARFFKINATSLNPKPSDGNTYRMQLSEVELYNTPKVNKIELLEVIDRAEKLDAKLYTKDSYAAMTECYNKAKQLYSKGLTSNEQIEIENAINRLTDAIEKLELKKKNNNTALIIVLSILGVIIVAGGIVTTLLVLKKKKKKGAN